MVWILTYQVSHVLDVAMMVEEFLGCSIVALSHPVGVVYLYLLLRLCLFFECWCRLHFCHAEIPTKCHVVYHETVAPKGHGEKS